MSPARLLLEAWSSWKAEAYRSDPAEGRWHADCPLCFEHRQVVVIEHSDAEASAWCLACGASQERIAQSLAAHVRHRDTATIAEQREEIERLKDKLERANLEITRLLDFADSTLGETLEHIQSANAYVSKAAGR